MRFGSVFSVLALAALIACDLPQAQPQSVDLTPDRVAVRMTDGSTCIGPAPPTGAEAGWSGRLQSCPWAYSYQVEIDPRTNPVRFVLQEVLGALGGDTLLSPIATVTLTDATGRQTVFETPERIQIDAD